MPFCGRLGISAAQYAARLSDEGESLSDFSGARGQDIFSRVEKAFWRAWNLISSKIGQSPIDRLGSAISNIGEASLDIRPREEVASHLTSGALGTDSSGGIVRPGSVATA